MNYSAFLTTNIYGDKLIGFSTKVMLSASMTLVKSFNLFLLEYLALAHLSRLTAIKKFHFPAKSLFMNRYWYRGCTQVEKTAVSMRKPDTRKLCKKILLPLYRLYN